MLIKEKTKLWKHTRMSISNVNVFSVSFRSIPVLLVQSGRSPWCESQCLGLSPVQSGREIPVRSPSGLPEVAWAADPGLEQHQGVSGAAAEGAFLPSLASVAKRLPSLHKWQKKESMEKKTVISEGKLVT